MGIDAQGDIGLGMPEALGNCDDTHAGINELAGMGVAKVVEGQVRHFDLVISAAKLRGEL